MKKLLITLVVIVVLGYFGYKQVTNYMANQVVKQVAKTLTPSDVAKLTNNSGMKKLAIDPNKVTPQDKKVVMGIVTKDFSASDIKDIAAKASSGNLTTADKQQLINEYKSKLSPEDLQKLKEIAAKQMQK